MTTPEKPDKNKPYLAGKHIPHVVDELMVCLNEIKEKGWKPEHGPKLADLFVQLHELAVQIEIPLIEVLVNHLNELLIPFLHPPYPSMPNDKLKSLYGYATKLKEALALHLVEGSPVHHVKNRPTLIIGLKDKGCAKELAGQLDYYSYRCLKCDSMSDLLQIAHTKNVGAILVDIDFCSAADSSVLKDISEKIPIIFISSGREDNTASRLFAVQSGGHAYFVRPIEFTDLIEKIDQLVTPVHEMIPYRILIIEDSNVNANAIKKHLIKAGMLTEILNNPLQVYDKLNEFQPDLIMMDLVLPQCSGIDLAKVIRQSDLFVNIPIIFLTAKNDKEKELNAINEAGDDYLPKSFTKEQLINAVKTRAQRYRTLRAGMTQDSLTGLLNHTRILEQLDLEIARSKRNKTPLCFAMLDIDYFKSVNDAHGHPVGDHVIKGLARLLKQRLRKIDSIGRYGGEEFTLILPDTNAEDFLKTLDDIRRGFANLLHRSSIPDLEFTATFSAGLAAFNEKEHGLDDLVQCADKALYQAKEAGRNRIVLFNQC